MTNNIQCSIESSTTKIELNSAVEGVFLVPELEGLAGLPEIRTTSGVNAGYDGGWTSAQNYDARLISIRGVIANPDVSKVEAKRRAIASLLGQGRKEELTLRLTTEAGNSYAISVRTISCEMALQRVLTTQEFLIQLRADDPLIYDDGASAGTEAILRVQKALGGFEINFELPLAISGGAENTIVENGEETVYPILKLYGPLHSPTVVNTTTNQQMQILADLQYTISWGNYQTATGSFITLNDGIKGAPMSLAQIDGNAEQDGTPTPDDPVDIDVVTGEQTVKITGKNLLNLTAKQATLNDVVCQLSGGTWTAVGTTTRTSMASNIQLLSETLSANGDYPSYATITASNSIKLPAGTYTFSATVVNNGGTVGAYGLYIGAGTMGSRVSSSARVNAPNPSATITVQDDEYITVGAYYEGSSGKTDVNFTASNIQLELGEATTYEPYQGQSYTIDLDTIKLAGIETSSIPDSYQRVDYIESFATTGQHIDLNYYSTADTRFVLDWQRVGSWSANSPVFGARVSAAASDTTKLAVWARTAANISEAIVFGSVDSSYVADTPSLSRHTISNIGANFYHNGTEVYTNTATKTTSSNSLYMFGLNSNGTADIRFNAMKLYGFKLYENGTLSADFVPCYRKADGAIGLYDVVRSQFYASASPDVLGKGSDITTPIKDSISQTTLTKMVAKIEGYNDETITTPYISTTGFLTSGATVYYALATPTETEITDSDLIDQLNFVASLYNGVNNISLVPSTGAQGEIEVRYATEYTIEQDVAVIDSQARTITINGQDAYHLKTDESEFLLLAPGENKLYLTSATDTDEGYAEVKFKQGYLSI